MSRKETPLLYEVKEKALMETILRMAKALNWSCYHTFDSRRSAPGFPDIVAVHPAHGAIFIECKTMTGRVSEHQKHWLDVLARAGQRAYLIRPSDMDFVEALLRGEDVEARAA